ncbi:MAG TPA: FtsX-like permease family protein, partial [Longimicrobiales bacterium]|nr:FtsX-like permease family protein [Longimicrobiales bacterium]
DAAGMIALAGRGTYRRSSLRAGLVAVQAALSILLLVGAGLFVRSFDRVSDVPLGFGPDNVLMFDWRRTGVDWNRARVHQLYDDGLERVRALPHVEAAAITTTAPMTSAFWGGMGVPGMDSAPLPDDAEEGPYFASVSTDYFRTVGARIISGRAFSDADVSGSRPVAIVTERTARMIWPGEEAVGKCFVNLNETDGACREVVGVVEDTRYREVLAEPSMMYYLPVAQVPAFALRTLLVRPRGDVDAAARAVRDALASLEPGLPHVQVTPLSSRVDPQLQPWRLGAFLFTGFGALALLLSTLGLYGVVAYDIAQRKRELGIRVALGAGSARVLTMVIGDAVRVIAAGLVIGLLAAVFAAQYVEPLLFDVSPRDPRVLGVAALLLIAVAVAAAALPAWRAAHVHPTEALRED